MQSFGIDEIMLAWSDPTHMIPAVNPAYCNVGAGVAKADNGRTYYILQAAYTSDKACGEYTSVAGGSNTVPGGVTGVSGIIIPVKIAKPDAEGRIYHEVKSGQSLWSIAVAYKITIADLETWNNISRSEQAADRAEAVHPRQQHQGLLHPHAGGHDPHQHPRRRRQGGA